MSTALAETPVTPGFQKATSQLSTTLGIEPRMMVESLKKQCFPGMRPEDISDSQLAAFISVANVMELNPLIPGMLYAYPSKNGGIIPVCGPDGVLKKLDEAIVANKLDGYECEVFPADVTLPPTHAVAKIYRTGKDHPSTFTAIFKEWSVGSNPNWSARPRHMIWLRAIKQCARQVIHGVPFDEDDLKLGNMVNVTPQNEEAGAPQPPPERPAPPKRSPKGAAAVTEAEKNRGAIDIPSTPVTTPPAATEPQKQPEPAKTEAAPPPKQEEKKVEPKPAPAGPRTTLIGEEEFVCTVEVKKVFALIINVSNQPTPSVQAVVDGEFAGPIFEFGGAKPDPTSGDLVATSPLWKVGTKVKVLLFGRVNKNSGAVMPVVRKVEPAEGSPDTAIDAG